MATPAPKLENIIALLRVSGDKQDVLRQRNDIESLKKTFPLSVLRTVELLGVSGTATLEHEDIQQILRELKKPGVKGVGVSSLDRLFRPGKRFGQWAILDHFLDNKKLIYSRKEGLIDISTDEGWEKCMAAGGRAGSELRQIRQRSMDGKRALAEIGITPHANSRFGWDIVGRRQTGTMRQGKHVINEREAAIVREMFERRNRGEATYAIAAWLNAEGIRNKRGSNGAPPKEWSRDTVLQLFESKDYIGQHFYAGILIPIPAIVSEDLFYSVQAKSEMSRKRWIGRPSSLYLLRSFLFCAVCGHRCIGMRSGALRSGLPRRMNYRCGNVSNKPPQKRLCLCPQVDAPLLEGVAWDALWSMIKDPALLLKMAKARLAEEAAPLADAADKIERTLARLQQRERNLTRLMKSAESDADYDEANQDRQKVRSEIAGLENDLRATGKVINLPPLQAVEASVRAIAEGPEPMTYAERRPILERLQDLRMRYANGEVTITGGVPVAVASDEKKCERGICATSNSFAPIPFVLKRKVA